MEKLIPVHKSILWGGEKLKTLFSRKSESNIAESWEVSVHPDGECGVGHETLSAFLKKYPRAVFPSGGEFPLLIKYIDAAQNLSVQVHPNDEYARRVENDNGKTEMWYVVQADEGAGIYCGFKRDVTKEEFLKSVQSGKVEELLNFIPVKAGDCYLIEAGTVHAICKGCVLLEIQESSNVTYRVYDYHRKDKDGKERELHLEKALEVIDLNAYRNNTGTGAYQKQGENKLRTLTKCKYFTCRELILNEDYIEIIPSSFTAVNIVKGSGFINGAQFHAGDSFFVRCGEQLSLSGKATVVLTNGVEKSYYIGVDLGGTYIKCGIVDEDGNIVEAGKSPTPDNYDDAAKEIARLADELAKKAGVTPLGVGVGSPGSIDGETGKVIYSNNLGWHDAPLKADLEKYLKIPVEITNDANAAALGEAFCGAGKNYRSFVLLTLGTGVGSGIVLDGKLLEGNHGVGAEFGHTVIVAGGNKCTCGRRGCLEAYASATALVSQTVDAMNRHRESALWKVSPDPKKVNGKTAFDAMRLGDETAKQVVDTYIGYLADGVTNAVNLFRPDAVILGGGVSAEGDALIKPLKEKVKELSYGKWEVAPVEIVTATLKNDAGICGAAKLAIDRSK